MANQVAARLGGDDYQHLYTWLLVLELRMPRKMVRRVTVEDETAGSFDDVTVRHEAGTANPDSFHQVKYHVDQRASYSVERLVHRDGELSSLLQKFFRSWRTLREEDPSGQFVLHLVSNWSWADDDPLRGFVGGHDSAVKAAFFDEGPRSVAGKARKKMLDHLGSTEGDFRLFFSSLRFTLGYDCGEELAQRVAERMDWLGLRSDEAALKTSAGIVREWIMRGRQEVDGEILDDAITGHGLLSQASEKCVTVYLSTIKEKSYEVAPDHQIDWRDHFEGSRFVKGHALKEGRDWNDDLLPDLYELEERVGRESGCRLIRARGAARLSPWFAFGHVFSQVSGYVIEVDQNGRLWRSDADASPNFGVLSTSEKLSEAGDLAVGISVSGPIEPRLREFVDADGKFGEILLIRPERELGHECFRGAGDVVAFVRACKSLMRDRIASGGSKNVRLFYFGPLSGACFLGHILNAMGAPVQVMEDQSPGYAPSFRLE